LLAVNANDFVVIDHCEKMREGSSYIPSICEEGSSVTNLKADSNSRKPILPRRHYSLGPFMNLKSVGINYQPRTLEYLRPTRNYFGHGPLMNLKSVGINYQPQTLEVQDLSTNTFYRPSRNYFGKHLLMNLKSVGIKYQPQTLEVLQNLKASGTSYRPTTTTTSLKRTYIPTSTYHSYSYHPSIVLHTGGYGYHTTVIHDGPSSSGGFKWYWGVAIAAGIIAFICCIACLASNSEEEGGAVIEETTTTTVVGALQNGPPARVVPPPYTLAQGGPTTAWCKNGHQMAWVQGNPYHAQGDDGPVCDSCNAKYDYNQTHAHCYTCQDDLCGNCAPRNVR
jgi:hypothetical protein